jgi:hypothetical protein
MTAMSNISVYDGEDTPVQHTFLPVSSDRDNGKNEAVWRENLSGVGLEAQPTVRLGTQRLRSGVYKVDLEVALPTQEVVTGSNAAGYSAAPKVAHVPRGKITFFFDERATQTERKNVRMIISNILRASTASNASGSGPGEEAVDLQILPV